MEAWEFFPIVNVQPQAIYKTKVQIEQYIYINPIKRKYN